MSNKLDEIKRVVVNQAKLVLTAPLGRVSDKDKTRVLENVFDAAIALNLPVKFSRWTHSQEWILTNDKKSYLWASINIPKEKWQKKTEEELYKYWIDNIYKPE